MDYEQFVDYQRAKEEWEEKVTFGIQPIKLINLKKLSKFYNKNLDLMVCPLTYNYRFNPIDIPNNKLLLHEFQKNNFRVKQLGKLTDFNERVITTKVNRFKNGKCILKLPKSLPFN